MGVRSNTISGVFYDFWFNILSYYISIFNKLFINLIYIALVNFYLLIEYNRIMDNNISHDSLKKKDSLLGIVLDSIFDGIYITDRDKHILFWNNGAENYTGYKSREVLSHRCSDNILVHTDDDGNVLCETEHCPIYRVFKYGHTKPVKVYSLHKNGSRFPAIVQMAPVKNDKGEIIAAIEIFRDISQDEQFRQLQEKFNNNIRKYVSEATYTKVLEDVHSDEAKNHAVMKEVTILYMDIVGFTKFSEENSPQAVVEMLNEVFALCEVITNEFYGDIDKFIGDCIMAVFISPEDAVFAAEKIINALTTYNKNKKDEIKIRIGINTGEVLHGEVGTKVRKDLTVIGDTVNTASRIESITSPNSIFISATTYQKLPAVLLAKFSFHSSVEVKGKKESLAVYYYNSL